MAVRRSVLDQIGLLVDGYFVYFEDTDLCLRARRTGYRVVYLPQAIAYHHVASSLGKGSADTLRCYHKSRIRFLLKHYDLYWFVTEFLSAEMEWIRCSAGLNDHLALQETYLWAIASLLEHTRPFQFARERFTAGERAAVMDTLCKLTDEVIHSLRVQAVTNAWVTETEKEIRDSRWRLREFPFVSSVPFLGPFIVFCREIWNNMATRWYVRKLMEQQMQINWELNANLEAQSSLLRVLVREVVFLQDYIGELQTSRNDLEGANLSK
jgi:hypothetical protein